MFEIHYIDVFNKIQAKIKKSQQGQKKSHFSRPLDQTPSIVYNYTKKEKRGRSL